MVEKQQNETDFVSFEINDKVLRQYLSCINGSSILVCTCFPSPQDPKNKETETVIVRVTVTAPVTAPVTVTSWINRSIYPVA